MAKTFYTPAGYSGSAELTASNGLDVISPGLWRFSQSGYNDGASFGLSVGWPTTAQRYYDYSEPGSRAPSVPVSGGELHLRAQNWTIAGVGNTLSSYDDPTYGLLPASQCRIQVQGYWSVLRAVNANSFNSFGMSWQGDTKTDQGSREFDPWLLSFNSTQAVYVIQGADVTGGAQDTFSSHEFWVRATEMVDSTNSNYEFQSNTITRPVWVYNYSKSWEIDV